ncbi:MAG: hypothetical protein EAZ92_10350 [Candidatus Kapaibacterium sp.]|nr:MAG: hypothetical protein EAZ92_10350 [Candidatus Kapabacteria bacterium]
MHNSRGLRLHWAFKKMPTSIIAALFLISSFTLFSLHLRAQQFSELAQFFPANGPFSGIPKTLVRSGSTLFVGIVSSNQDVRTKSGMFQRSPQDSVWVRLTGVPDSTNIQTLFPIAHSTQPALLLMYNASAGNGKLLRSVSSGRTWTVPTGVAQGFTHIVESGQDTLLARTGIGTGVPTLFYRSIDAGVSWAQIQQSRNSINSIVSYQSPRNPSNKALFGGSNGLGLFRSTNNGSNWQQVSFSAPSQTVTVLAFYASQEDVLYLSTNHGIYTSNDAGLSWTAINKGLEMNRGTQTANAFKRWQNRLFAATNMGLMEWKPNEQTKDSSWVRVDVDGITANDEVIQFAEFSSSANSAATQLLLLSGQGVFRFAENGGNQTGGNQNTGNLWQPINTGLSSIAASSFSLASEGNTLAAVQAREGVFRASLSSAQAHFVADNQSLQNLGVNLPLSRINPNQTAVVPPRIFSGKNRFVLTTQTGIFTTPIPSQSSPNLAWKAADGETSGTEITSFAVQASTQAASGSGRFYAGAKDGVVIRSSNDGATWMRVQTDFTASVNSILAFGQRLFAGTNSGLAESINNGDRWSLVPAPRWTSQLAISALGAAWESETLLAATPQGIYRSSNNGATWLLQPNSNDLGTVNAFLERQGTFYAATSLGIYRSSDNGRTWSRISPSTIRNVLTLADTDTALALGTADNSFFTTALPPRTASAPVITSLSSDSAIVGSPMREVIVRGRNFAQNMQIEFGGLPVAPEMVRIVSAVEVRCTLQSSFFANIGDIIFSLINPAVGSIPSQQANTLFRVLDVSRTAPVLLSVQPDSLFVNEPEVITLNGLNFSNCAVSVNTEELTPTSNTGTRISLAIPLRLVNTLGTRQIEIRNRMTNERASFALRVVERPETPPVLGMETASLQEFRAYRTFPSDVQEFVLSATNAPNGVLLQVSRGFQLALNSGVWSSDSLRILPMTSTNQILPTRVAVRFFPQADFPINLTATQGTVRVLSGRQRIFLREIPLRGSLNVLALEISSSNSIDFRRVRVGSTTQAMVRVVNPSPLSFVVNVVQNTSQTSAVNSAFRVEPSTFTLDANAVQMLVVSYSPQQFGVEEGSVQLVGAASARLDFKGEGGQARFEFAKNEILFSTAAYVRQRRSFPTEQVTVRNTGTVEEEIRGVQFDKQGVFALANAAPMRLAAGQSTTLTLQVRPAIQQLSSRSSLEERVESRLQLVTQFPATQGNISVRAVLNVLPPPEILQPNNLSFASANLPSPTNTGFVSGTIARLQWQNVANADRYEWLWNNQIAQLLASRKNAESATSAVLMLTSNMSYHWSVRSVKLDAASQDTLVVSDWQEAAFFHTFAQIPPAVAQLSGLDFGETALERERQRVGMLGVPRDSILLQNLTILGDTAAFRISARPRDILGFAPLPSSIEYLAQYPLSLSFIPQEARNYAGRAVLSVQEPTRLYEWSIPLRGSGIICQSPPMPMFSCPEASFELRLVRANSPSGINTSSVNGQFLVGEPLLLQVRLREINAAAQVIQPRLRRVQLHIGVHNSSLSVISPTLRTGTPAKGREAEAVRVFPQPVRRGGGRERQDALISIDIERPLNAARDAVLAEIPVLATASLRNFGTSRNTALDSSVFFLAADPIWRDENDGVVPNMHTFSPPDSLRMRVNTCPDSVRLGTSLTTALHGAQNSKAALFLHSENPLSGTVSFSVVVRKEMPIEIDLINSLGKRIATTFQHNYALGEYRVDFPCTELPTGSYFLVLRTPFERIPYRVEVVK